MLIIKVGGGKKNNWHYIAEDLISLSQREKIIIVHGANEVRAQLANDLNHPVRNIVSPSGISSVYTDEKALDILLMAYAGLTNKRTVALLQKYGLQAVGLSGIDGGLWRAKRKKVIYIKEGKKTKLIKGNLTGKVETINTELVNLLLKNNYLPVLTTPAISYENEIVNTDNDFATAVMASQLKAKKIIYLFEAPGLLKDVYDDSSLIKEVKKENLEQTLKFGQGRMKKKILSVRKAFEGGVEKVYFGDGRIKTPITALLNDRGGTVIF